MKKRRLVLFARALVPYLPFIVLFAAVLVGAYHISTYW